MLDYIIVGQGLAGSFLAKHLFDLQKKIEIIDVYNPKGSSSIASGIANPITGRKMVKTWEADDVFPYSYKKYLALENQFQKKYTSSIPLVKVFSSKEDQVLWQKKSETTDYKDYTGEIFSVGNTAINQPFACAEIKQGYWVNVPELMQDFRHFFLTNNVLREEVFDYQALEIFPGKIKYKQLEAKRIVFCEGYKVIFNHWFNYLPFTTAKGDLLYIYSPQLNLKEILTKGIHLVPLSNDNYLLGSTFIWHDLSETVSEEGRAELYEKLSKLINCPFEIINETAGIRPTIKDRRPVLGVHPIHQNLYIFNGLGTKGVTLSARMAEKLIAHIEDNLPIEDEISINRFINDYK